MMKVSYYSRLGFFFLGLVSAIALILWAPVNLEGGDSKGLDWVTAFADHKDTLLEQYPEPVILFVGGSNVLYGVDAQAMSDALDRPVFNYGLGAALGLPYILQRSAQAAKSGDVIVLTLEEQLYRMITQLRAGRAYAKAVDGTLYEQANWLDIAADISALSMAQLMGQPKKKDPRFYQLYQTSNLQPTGDFIIPEQVQTPPPLANKALTPSPELHADMQRLIHEYVTQLAARNIKVIAVPPTRYASYITRDAYRAFYSQVAHMYQQMDVPFIAHDADFAYPARAMFDSVNHLHPQHKQANALHYAKLITPFL